MQLPALHGATQCPETQTLPPLQEVPDEHGVGLPAQTPFASHEKPVGQGCVASHCGVQAPSTHWAVPGHCVASLHWSLGATQEPFRHLAPLPSLFEQVESAEHSGAGAASAPASVAPLRTHETLPPLSVQA